MSKQWVRSLVVPSRTIPIYHKRFSCRSHLVAADSRCSQSGYVSNPVHYRTAALLGDTGCSLASTPGPSSGLNVEANTTHSMTLVIPTFSTLNSVIIAGVNCYYGVYMMGCGVLKYCH